MVTLAELAQQQVENSKDNPYLTGYAPPSTTAVMPSPAPIESDLSNPNLLASNAPMAEAPVIIPPSAGGFKGAQTPGSVTAGTTFEGLVTPTPTWQEKEIANQEALNAPAPKAEIQHAVPGAKPSTPKVTPKSPERIELETDEGIRKEKAQNLTSQQDTLARQRELLQVGEQAAQAAQAKANSDYDIKQIENEQLGQVVDQQMKARQAAQDQEAAQVRAAKVDPRHWFKEKGTAGSILAAISMAAGAFAAAMPHTGSHENFALNIINKAVDQDIDAQKEDIANKWKSLNYKGDENQKAYVRDQYMMNQKRELAIKGYDHALALVGQQRATTNNDVAALDLDKLSQGIQDKKLDLQMEQAAHAKTVAVGERARAAAAGVSNPNSAANLEKAYNLYVTDAMKEQQKNPKAGAILSKEDWFKTRQGSGAPARAAESGKEVEEGLASLGKKYDAVSANNPVFSVLPNSPDAMAVRQREQLNSDIIATVHAASRGLRDPHIIEQTTKPFLITPYDNAASVAQKKAALAQFVIEHKKTDAKDAPSLPEETSK